MKQAILLVLLLVLALGAIPFWACGNEAEQVEPAAPAPVTEPAAPAPAAPAEPPTDTTSADDAMMPDDKPLSAECATGGLLTDADVVISCNREAMQGFQSFSFDGAVDLFAAFPVEGAPPGGLGMMLSGDVVLPDRTSFTLTLGPEGEQIQTRGVLIGQDFYTQDPATQLWFKGAPEDNQSLAPLQLIGMLYLPQDIPTTLEEVIDLDDGGKGYVLVSDGGNLGEAAAMFGLMEQGLTRVVGADDFLTREVRVTVEGPDGQSRDLFTVRYQGFGEALSVEAPANFMELPPGAMSGGAQEPATVVGLSRNAEGNVEVQFSEPVIVEGEVILYVLEPSTGGWELPLLSGSGTDTLVFDAAAEGRPTLVAGEHQIAWIGFGTNGEIVDEDGVRANDLFDTWTYE